MVNTNFSDSGVGGGNHAVIQPVLLCHGPSCPAIWVRYVRPESPHGTEPQGLPPQGIPFFLRSNIHDKKTEGELVVLPNPR